MDIQLLFSSSVDENCTLEEQFTPEQIATYERLKQIVECVGWDVFGDSIEDIQTNLWRRGHRLPDDVLVEGLQTLVRARIVHMHLLPVHLREG